jgi:hypothetical protein
VSLWQLDDYRNTLLFCWIRLTVDGTLTDGLANIMMRRARRSCDTVTVIQSPDNDENLWPETCPYHGSYRYQYQHYWLVAGTTTTVLILVLLVKCCHMSHVTCHCAVLYTVLCCMLTLGAHTSRTCAWRVTATGIAHNSVGIGITATICATMSHFHFPGILRVALPEDSTSVGHPESLGRGSRVCKGCRCGRICQQGWVNSGCKNCGCGSVCEHGR